MTGLVHIYTGDGKGKTTASMGLAVRAAGDGLRVMVIQFLKGRLTGELEPLKRLGIAVHRSPDVTKFIPYMTPEERESCRKGQQACLKAARDNLENVDLMVLDEAIPAAATGMISLSDLTALVREKPPQLELVLTGRDAPPELLELADYVSDIRAVKHPYEHGIGARKGIEY